MLKGKTITLRPVRASDLDCLYDYHQDIGNRGAYFPLGVLPEPLFQQKFRESGFWGEEEGLLLLVTAHEEIAGHIEFFRTVSYLDELELSYHIYRKEHRGKGMATEAVLLLTRYLFDRKKHNRIRLMIHPENAASKRVAEKCGYRREGVARGAWFHHGQSCDVEVYAILRAEAATKKEMGAL